MAKAEKPEEKKAQAQEAAEVTELVENLDPEAASVDASAIQSPKEPTKITKAGPKARKAQAEADQAAEKKEAKPKAAIKQSQAKRDPLARRGKKYKEALAKVDRTKAYGLSEGLELAVQTSTVKFDASVEMHINLGVDPRQADQVVRSTVVLPAGTGKSLRVAVLTADKQTEAKQAGADIADESGLMADIEKGKLDFDVLITSPDMMPKLAKLAKVLGPKGLMPNPKSGTVTSNVVNAVKEAKAGRVEFRIDRQAIIHQAIGKASFKPEDLLGNAKTLINAIMQAKPAGAKGTYMKAVTISSSMGPGIKLDVTQTIAEARTK